MSRGKFPLVPTLLSLPRLLRPKINLGKLDKKVVFVLSTGRTGTQFLAHYFNEYPDVFAVHEPPPSWRLRMWSMAFVQGRTSTPVLRRVINKFRGRSISRLTEPVYLESNNFAVGFAPAIKAEFKNAVIIHVVRDPRDYITSALNHGADSGLKGLANRYFPYWHLRSGLWANPKEIFERTARYWTIVDELLSSAGRGYPHYYRFTFEQLFAADTKALAEIAKALGLKLRPDAAVRKQEKANVSRLRVMPNWPDWTAEQAKIVDKICGAGMKRYGYGREPNWRALLKALSEGAGGAASTGQAKLK
ncbi:sulfotransferase domain-containing protein [Candidatus Saccharibacteria bacterium]|nr:sulfotransferase domain-containing protein [Candidatus Saccharibacteria bacterium]